MINKPTLVDYGRQIFTYIRIMMTKSNRIYQVAVVGAGTAGLLAADVILVLMHCKRLPGVLLLVCTDGAEAAGRGGAF